VGVWALAPSEIAKSAAGRKGRARQTRGRTCKADTARIVAVADARPVPPEASAKEGD
jgi:hypothetical protein